MNICREIWKYAATLPNQDKELKFHVVDTLQTFWQGVYNEVSRAQRYDVTALVSPFSQASPCLRRFERSLEFTDLSPSHPRIWAEAAENQMPAKMAALLTFEEYDERSGQAERARQCGILGQVQWICRARCFMKRRYKKALPLQWEWQEYINADGRSSGSLLQPIVFPEYVDTLVDHELKSINMLQTDLCAFIANLGLYAVNAINGNRTTLSQHRSGTFDFQMVR